MCSGTLARILLPGIAYERLACRPAEERCVAIVSQTREEFTEFDLRVGRKGRPGLYGTDRITTVQVNIGLVCNLTCRHCHVNSSPRRTEAMDWETMTAVLRHAKSLSAEVVDITGGAPEMHPDFKRFVLAARSQGHEVIVRTNLTILLEPGYEDLPEFFADHAVHLVASLPCYLEENVDKQRGEGVYSASIEAICKLNALGYGNRPDLALDLVYNPGGPVIPPDQKALEEEYRSALAERFGIAFTRLYTITNVPIGRFKGDLRRQHGLDDYMNLLRDSFNPATVDSLMCRHQISVGWDGTVYDCDFNLALRAPVNPLNSRNVRDLDPDELLDRCIVTGDHCYACTAGPGSSCSGSLV